MEGAKSARGAIPGHPQAREHGVFQDRGGTCFRLLAAGYSGIGTSSGVTFMLQDRSGKDVAFLAEQVAKIRRRSQGAKGTGWREPDVFARRPANFPEC
jgi:hypothetical protein